MKNNYTRLLASTVLTLFFSLKIAAQPIVINSQVASATCNACNGSIDLTVTGGTPPYNYNWLSIPGTNDPADLTNLCGSTYIVTVTDAVGITKSATISVNQATQILPAYSWLDVACFGGNTGLINAVPNGGMPPLTYTWSNGATTNSINNLVAGTYCLTVVDANGCSMTDCRTITEPPALNPTLCVTNVKCFGGCTGGMIDLSVTGGSPGYTYTWGNGATTQDLSNICAGTYAVTVMDAKACTKTASATVGQPAAIVINSSIVNASNGINNGAIDITVIGGTPPYTPAWGSQNGPLFSTAFDITNLSAGSYCITVTDALGCTRTSCYTIQNNGGGNNSILLSGQVTNGGCGMNCDGSIEITINNGFVPYYYTLASAISNISGSSDQASFVLPSLCPGAYQIQINDGAGQLAFEDFFVGQNQSQTLPIQSSNSAFCNFDPGGNSPLCEMVCPKTTVTYFVDPPVICFLPVIFSGVNWVVSGAESYSIIGNEVVVNWGEAGPGLVEFSGSSQGTCYQGQHCVTVLEEPVAKFSTDPPAMPNAVMQLCKGQTLAFKNESLNAELFEWQFSDDLSILSTENPKHTFFTPGDFKVTLIARSNCLCADTSILLIQVLDTEPPLLDCVGSVCPGETVTYATSSNCSAYTWQVSPNGSILQGGQSGDNTITIQWADGPTGSISLSASGCAGAACPQASVFNISIISDNAEIRGNEFVCPNSEEAYSIDLFNGTEYTWTLPTGGNILRGQGTNKVAIAWTAQVGTSHWLIVDYYNCYLGCGGTDSIPVKILSPFFIDGPVEMCEHSTKNYHSKTSTNLDVNCNWSVYGPNGALVSSLTGAFFNFTPAAGPGNYRLFAVPTSPNQSCSQNAELKVSVAEQPSKPVAISGPKLVCPGTPLQYEVPGNPPYEIEWKTGNGTPALQTGNPVNINWNTNPTHWISAVQISLDGLGCKSDTTRLNIQNATAISISGPPNTCEGGVAFYQADFYQGFDYQWELIPANAGSIKQGQGKNNIEIFWQTPGVYQLKVTICGLSTSFNVSVWANPKPMPNHPDGLCQGTFGVASVAGSYGSYTWEEASGTPLGNNPNVNIPAGAYTIAVTDIHGCRGTSEFSIDPLPAPNVTATTSDPTGFCNNSRFVSITALVPDDGVFDYEWYQDGVPLNANVPVYSTNQYGDYSVVVTNAYGCTADDGIVRVFEYCGGVCHNPNHGPKCQPGDVKFSYDLTPRCDSFQFQLTTAGLYQAGSAVWHFGESGSDYLGNATGDTPGFVFPNAGKYIIVLYADLTNGAHCVLLDSVDVEASAQFSQKLACPGDSTLFSDESTRLPNMTISNWDWDFGSAGNADTSSLASPGYPYASSGNYTATLTITTATGCTSSYSENVLVPNVPSPAFAPPLANCAGNATAFVLASNAGLIGSAWNFGDPVSGALNQSSANPAYHNYSPAGNYPVTVTATNGYGCTASVTQPVSISANPFSGIIFPPTSTICQGSSLTLSAPLGPGAMYVWNDGTNQPTLLVNAEGIYDVTLTNGNGCTYSPPAKTVDVNPAPIGTIKFLEVNDLGQVVGVQYPEASVCAGDDVTLHIQDNGNYTFSWSGGNGSDGVLVFSEDRNNLLSVGTHTFTVTVTNPSTGCTSVLAPFTVTVNPIPNNFSLSTNNVCAGTPSTITYTGPQPPGWQIFWNTGDAGPSLQTDESGLYFVRVVNEFGCSAQSNTVVIFPGPNISALPSGCHERCNPDTLCLPPLPEIVSWQWFFEGSAIPGATSHQFAATQSGTYWAELMDINGCEASSAPLTVELYNGFGNILGQIWSDMNDNEIIDAADTLVSGIPVQLLQNGIFIAPGQSGANGSFDWLSVPSTDYTVQIDTQLLSPLWKIVLFSDSVGLKGCGGKVFASLLVDAYTCPPITATVSLMACAGQSALFNGTAVPTGQSQNFTFKNFLGCDSIVTVTVSAFPASSSTLNAKACPGSFYTYNGVDLAVGQSQNFTLSNWLSCDSIVSVNISAFPTSSSTLNAKACPGSFYTYNGVDLAVGQSQNFTLSNWLGCDSIVTVSVSAFPASSSTLNAKACPGSFYTYNGVDLAVGQSQNFTLSNFMGCDSIVTVTVSAFQTSSSTLNAKACPGSFYTYNGVDLAVGQSQDFTLSNFLGCDSIVTVTVSAFPTSSSTLNAKACPGSFYTYNGVDLAPGQIQNFTLTNSAGCDSVVTVTVSVLPTSSSAISVGVCAHETYTYAGVVLTENTTQDFVLTNSAGCDSVVTVTVFGKPSSLEFRTENVCPGEVYIFENQAIAIGETRTFQLINSEGCDSTITIFVTSWPAPNVELETEISCPNTPTGSLSVSVLPGGSLPDAYSLDNITFQNSPVFESLGAGSQTVFVRDEKGCVFEKTAVIPASPGLALELPNAFVIPCDSAQITIVPTIGGDTTGLQLLWWNGAKTPSVTVGEPRAIWLEASNHCETLRSEGEVSWADSEGDTVLIFLPNVFAPESKLTENALFRPFFGKNLNLLSYHLEVYDRWGNFVFESETPENGWPGNFNQASVGTQVFVWQMWVRVAFCGRELEIYKKGDVTVVR